MSVPESWRDRWPIDGVVEGPPASSAGSAALVDAGYSYVADLEVGDEDIDPFQLHLSNVGALRLCNEMRVAYTAANLAPAWPKWLAAHGAGVVVREQHVQYDTEAFPDEMLVGGMRVAARKGRAAIIEQQIVTAKTARSILLLWVVLLAVRDGSVIEFPAEYWAGVEAAQGAALPVWSAPATRPPWGPGPG